MEKGADVKFEGDVDNINAEYVSNGECIELTDMQKVCLVPQPDLWIFYNFRKTSNTKLTILPLESSSDLEKLQVVQAALVDILSKIPQSWGHFESSITHFLLKMEKEELKTEN